MSISSMPPASGATGQDASDQGSDQGIDPANGYRMCVDVSPDRQLSVSVEPLPQGSTDGASSDDSESQQVPSIQAACKIVMDIFKNAGQMNDMGAEQDAMSQAYGPSKATGGASGMGGM